MIVATNIENSLLLDNPDAKEVHPFDEHIYPARFAGAPPVPRIALFNGTSYSVYHTANISKNDNKNKGKWS